MPYKQGVVGSNPTGPTSKKPDTKVSGFFYLRSSEIRFCKRLIKKQPITILLTFTKNNP